MKKYFRILGACLAIGLVIAVTGCQSVQAQASVPEGFVRITGGTFTMGSPANEAGTYSDETQRQVTVSGFFMGKYEVTQREYEEIMGTNPSHFKGDNLPVENVTWFDAIEYCNKRSEKEGLTPAYTISGRTPAAGYPITRANVTWNRNANGYRLPTEAEWEYACRAGTTTAYNTGSSITGSQARFGSESTMSVGSYAPNAWGLHDMHGNVSEWCWDWFGAYPSVAQTDPTGASSGSARVGRGGGWRGTVSSLRSARRGENYPNYPDRLVGFRLVRPF